MNSKVRDSTNTSKVDVKSSSAKGIKSETAKGILKLKRNDDYRRKPKDIDEERHPEEQIVQGWDEQK